MDKIKFISLKLITDHYIAIMHQLKGYQLDSRNGFELYLKKIENQQEHSIRDLKVDPIELDKAQYIYSAGRPDDPDALILHECSQGELKARLRKDGQNDIFVKLFCLTILYEYWEDIRGKLAEVVGIERNEVKSDVFGDIRYLRHDIIHNKGIATSEYSAKAKILTWFKNDDRIVISDERFDFMVGKIFGFLNEFLFTHTGEKVYQDMSLSLTGRQRHLRYIKAGKVTVKE